MVPFKVRLLITLTLTFPFHGLVNNCPEDHYQTQNNPQRCRLCTKCDGESGSVKTSACRKLADTTCRCLQGFSEREANFATCKCDKGSGLEKTVEGLVCRKCKDGFFTNKINTPCAKWEGCLKSGVKIHGTSTSDAICNEKYDGITTLFPSPSEVLLTQSLRTLEHNSTTKMISVLIPKVTTKGSEKDMINPNKNGTIVFVGFAVLLLLVLGGVTYRITLIPCIQKYRKPLDEAHKDSLCRKPVEESGNSSDSSLVKGNEGEP